MLSFAKSRTRLSDFIFIAKYRNKLSLFALGSVSYKLALTESIVVLEKTLESPLDCKEISPGISLEGMMLKLKLQYFGHLMRRVDSLQKTLMLGGIGGRRRRG